MNKYDVIVVGGGPAGMMAAGQAALLKQKTLLIEKMDRPGRKLLLSGKHRCNLTNMASVEEALNEFNREGRFLTQLFYRFYNNELRNFFSDLGIPTVEQRGGRVFPESEKARDVVLALKDWTIKAGVEIKTGAAVRELIIYDNHIEGVITTEGDFLADAVILATGGKSYPGTGSTGDGYQFARLAGHTIKPLRPALVPLVTAGNTAKNLQGLSLKNVSVIVFVNGKKFDQLFGEMLFTHFGLSGPVILTLSKGIVEELEGGKEIELVLDLKPALSHQTLDERLLRDIQTLGKKQFSSLLEGLLPKKLVSLCAYQINIPLDKKNSQLSSQERKKILSWLKDDFRFKITGHNGFDEAIITAGGIDTKDIDPVTMESQIIRGLYFAGEILNIDANTGGYNLQAAFTTGWAAGIATGSTSEV